MLNTRNPRLNQIIFGKSHFTPDRQFGKLVQVRVHQFRPDVRVQLAKHIKSANFLNDAQ